jgi:pimeloyl-ACP methyl ester carboxylesterase
VNGHDAWPHAKERDVMTDIRTRSSTAAGLHVETWGEGAPVVLVHGSLATSKEEWVAQQDLGSEGFRFVAPDRRGYGASPTATGEDWLVDAEDIAELMGDGAHLVGHSYGGIGALVAAALRPEATLSLSLLEPATFSVGYERPAAREMIDAIRSMWDSDADDDTWVVEFLKGVGSDPDDFPPDFLEAARPLVPLIRNGRPIFEGGLPVAEVAAARFPKLVVSGGHSTGFDAICDAIAAEIGAARAVAEGAGHEVQFAAPRINELLLALWRTAR